MTKENLEKLKKHVYKLHKLLELGQPGHFSWCLAAAEEWKAIAEMWSKPNDHKTHHTIKTETSETEDE